LLLLTTSTLMYWLLRPCTMVQVVAGEACVYT